MLPDRIHTRMTDYDYTATGAYMVHICAADRQSHFGEIKHGEMRLSRLGTLVDQHWRAIPQHHGPRVEVDLHQVMPNHFHGIIFLWPPKRFPDAPDIPHLGNIVGGFKGGVTREWRQLCGDSGKVVWQPRFYEHIIRHEKALQRIREYIVNNPRQWSIDRENPQATGLNEFYTWLEAYCQKILLR